MRPSDDPDNLVQRGGRGTIRLRPLLALLACAAGCSSDPPSPDAGAGAPAVSTSAPRPFTGTIRGAARFKGVPPPPSVPKHLEVATDCPRDLVEVPVHARDGKLRDVLVRLAGEVPFARDQVPTAALSPVLTLHACALDPRVQGALVESSAALDDHEVEVRIERPSFHGVLSYRRGDHQWFTAGPVEKKWLDVPAVWRFVCQVHPWERAFIVATPHPYFAVTSDDGEYALVDVPVGIHEVEAWHPHYGWKRQTGVAVRSGETTEVDLAYVDSDTVPEESR